MNNSSKHNLREFLQNNKVQIPILQRDYAQGRNKQKQIRERFLDALFEFLNSKDEEKSLDFIYGYIEGNVFLPIDGQQRITTLWLLHIFLSSQLENKHAYEYLKKFTYATRDTAKKFCEKLCSVKFTELPSKILKNSGMIKPLLTDGDPTVISMVTMLDAIHNKFSTVDAMLFLERLDRVKFYSVNMGHWNLGEELYIKMNARGKQLNTFENFKSWIQKDEEIKNSIELLASIDNNWINYFWEKDKEQWEQQIIKFISNLAIFFVLSKTKDSEARRNFIVAHLDNKHSLFEEKLFDFNGEKIFGNNELLLIEKIIRFIISQKIELPANSLVKTLSLPKLFSLFLFVENNNPATNYHDWIDVTNHIIDNTRPKDNLEHIVSMFHLLHDMKPYSDNILQKLADNCKIESRYSTDRTVEERTKAILIINDGRNNEWESQLKLANEHGYFKGWFDFLLDYSKDTNGNYSLNKFKEYSEAARILFEPKTLEENLKLLQIALLSFVDYSVWNMNWYLGNESIDDLQHGKEQWARIFRQENDATKSPCATKLLLDAIIAKKLQSASDLEDALHLIIEENLNKQWSIGNWWRWLMVKYDNILGYCRQNRFKRDNNNGTEIPAVYLSPSKKIVTYGVNLLTYGLFHYLYNNYKSFNLSEYNDDINEKFCFKINNKINVENELLKNCILVKKGKVERTFEFSDTTANNYDMIENFYAEIKDYVVSLAM